MITQFSIDRAKLTVGMFNTRTGQGCAMGHFIRASGLPLTDEGRDACGLSYDQRVAVYNANDGMWTRESREEALTRTFESFGVTLTFTGEYR
jgi:hypothetical protein